VAEHKDARSELLAAGVAVEKDPDYGDALSLDRLRYMCAREERVLRLQYSKNPDDPGELPPEWEFGLRKKGRGTETLAGALSRWTYLSHLYRIRSEGLTREQVVDEETVRRLIRREPIYVDLPTGRRLTVTGRSYSALYEIARHSVRLRELDTEIERIAVAEARLLALIARKPSRSGCTNSTAGCSPRRVSTDRRSMRTCSRRPARQRTALPMRRSGGWN
jgi:hypothetical protein